jgi:ABC-type nitrate/sulfonate/bicarbonate transport system substrate-binding protein
MIVTERAGLFAKNGLDVKSRIMGGAVGVVRGLMQGEIQFGNLAAPALLRANLLGEADLVYLTGGINQQFLMGRPGIEERRQLAGGKIGLVGDRGLNDVLVYFVIEQLKKQGVDGVTPIPIEGSGHKGVESLVRGACDAAIVTPPECIGAKRRGCSYLVDFADYGLNFALGGIAARKSYIAAHPDITRKFVKAYVEGMHRYRTDRAFTAQVQQEYSGLSDRSLAEETYDMTRPGMPRVPYPVLTALKIALEVMSRELPQAAGADPGQFVDDSFLRELDDSGFIASLYGET